MEVSYQENPRKPKDTPFRQQRMKSFKPVLSFGSAVCIFGVFGLVFTGVGAALLGYSSEIIEVKVRYDDKDPCSQTSWDSPRVCSVSLLLEEDIPGPVYVYYELRNFYQNNRKYVKSKSDKQLMGEDLSLEELGSCEPVKTMEDLQVSTESSQPANPCGLVAKTVFNDTFALENESGKQIAIKETEISWETDRERKFKRLEGNWTEKQWLDVEDEHFIVWMRISGLPQFRKLWGRIEQDLESGEYFLNVQSNYDVSFLEAEKWVVLSNTNALGGDNTFLGSVYTTIGCILLSLGTAFGIKGVFFKV